MAARRMKLGVVCIFIALASDSSLQKRFQKGLDAIKPLIILPHLTFNYCFYTCGANTPVASNHVSHATPPAFLLPCVAPGFHSSTTQQDPSWGPAVPPSHNHSPVDVHRIPQAAAAPGSLADVDMGAEQGDLGGAHRGDAEMTLGWGLKKIPLSPVLTRLLGRNTLSLMCCHQNGYWKGKSDLFIVCSSQQLF